MARKSKSSNSVTVVNQNDTEKVFKHKIGLVFDGGGAKGAYQIGVWRALREAGLEQYVTDVAGTSVGGLNAALFIQGDLETAIKVWTQKVSSIKWYSIADNLKILIHDYLGDMEYFSTDHRNCFLTVTKKNNNNPTELFQETADGKSVMKYSSGDAEYINMRFVDPDKRKNIMENATLREKILLATSALPILCRSIKMERQEYIDGGMVDNSPVVPLLEATQCDMIIVVHLDADAENKRNAKTYSGVSVFDYQGVSVIDISPSQETGHLFGTLEFDNEKAAWLMELGYNDTRNAFDRIVKNWSKELLVTESGEPISKIIETLNPEDKYRLYNECEFLVRGNYAKLNYLSEDGFGNTILRVITGGGIKAKKQILENTVALQEKMMGILVCLDDEMHNMKLGMHYLFYRSLSISDILLSQHRESLIVHDILDKLIKNAEYTGKFLAEKYPEYVQMDIPDLKRKLNELTVGINIRIGELNEINQKAFEIHQAQIEASAKRISEAKEVKVLRLTPRDCFVVSAESIETIQILDSTANTDATRWNKVSDEIIKKHLDTNIHSAIILPAGNKHPSIKTISPAEYFMFLWFANTPISKRMGKYVCMIDFYNHFYVYCFKVSDDGKSYISMQAEQKNEIGWGESSDKILKAIKNIFSINHEDGVLIYRTFESIRNSIEDNLNCTDYVTIHKVDPNWEKALTKKKGQMFVDFVDQFINKVYE